MAALACAACESAPAVVPAPAADAAAADACGAPIACREAPSHTHRVCVVITDASCSASLRQDDGTEHGCASCGDCAAAEVQVSAWCATLGGDAGSDAPDVGGIECVNPVPCAAGSARSYRTCALYDGGVCGTAYLLTHDGRPFYCATCRDCAAANVAVDTWCRFGPDAGGLDAGRDAGSPSDSAAPMDAPPDAAGDALPDGTPLGLLTPLREPARASTVGEGCA